MVVAGVGAEAVALAVPGNTRIVGSGAGALALAEANGALTVVVLAD